MCWHRLTKICWQKLAGHCVGLFMLRQCRQPNRGAEACQSKSRSNSKRLVPSQQVVLVREHLFVKTLGSCVLSCACFRGAVVAKPGKCSCPASHGCSPAPANLAVLLRVRAMYRSGEKRQSSMHIFCAREISRFRSQSCVAQCKKIRINSDHTVHRSMIERLGLFEPHIDLLYIPRF